MLRTNNKIVIARIENYLIDCAESYAGECLENDNLPREAVKQFIIDDVRRVAGHWKKYGIIAQCYIEDYLRGLPFSIDYTFCDTWQRMNEFLERNAPIDDASEEALYINDNRYWALLASVIYKWIN